MSDNSTIARPYAKAIFEYAQETKALANWSLVLDELSVALALSNVQEFINNPAVTKAECSELLSSLFERIAGKNELVSVHNMIDMLAQNKRLELLPEIATQYNAMRAEEEKTLTVEVQSFDVLTKDQEEKLALALSKRLQREVNLNVSIDKSLLGGAIITAGDLVIDGSVRGQLNKLRSDLAA